MIAKSSNFLSALVVNTDRERAFLSESLIFIPGQASPPSLGPVYHGPLDGPL